MNNFPSNMKKSQMDLDKSDIIHLVYINHRGVNPYELTKLLDIFTADNNRISLKFVELNQEICFKILMHNEILWVVYDVNISDEQIKKFEESVYRCFKQSRIEGKSFEEIWERDTNKHIFFLGY